jgi:hypothetical protein
MANPNAKLTPKMKAAQFKKGQSGNPKGFKQNPPIRALKNFTIDTYREVIELVLKGNLRELKAMIEDPTTSAIQVGVATAFMVAIKKGDHVVMERIAERIVGKIPDVVNVNAINNSKVAVTVSAINPAMLKEELAKLEAEV